MARIVVNRLTKELKSFSRDVHPGIFAMPNPTNILEWHFVFAFVDFDGSPFAGGVYYGQLKFPSEYPNKPPSVRMMTPSGRFEPGQPICMSLTNFHPESWNPSWKAASILTGLLSYMHDSAVATGAIKPDPARCRQLAAQSLEWNIARCPKFRDLFKERIPEWRARQAGGGSVGRQERAEDHDRLNAGERAEARAEERAEAAGGMGNRATGDPSPGGAVLSLAWLAAASFVVILAMGIRWGLQGIDVW